MKPGDKNKAALYYILRSFPEPVVKELVFHPDRDWRFDFAVPSLKLAVEYHGIADLARKKGDKTPRASGHSSVKGLTNDCEKFNQARLLGWTVLTFTALHFDAKSRAKHKLSTPLGTITAMRDRLLKP